MSGLSPGVGLELGGTDVTISGSGFANAAAVDFGSSPATNYMVVSGTEIEATAPAGSGVVDVSVTTPVGTSSASSADHFTYDAVPTVTSVSPAAGGTGGGDVVTVTGTGFDGVTGVEFGSTPAASYSVVSASEISATSPSGIVGTADVEVSNPVGTSADSVADLFEYEVTPVVTAVSPPAGLPTGGGLVTISGSELAGATAVDFGTVAVTNYVVESSTQVIVTAPAASVGTVEVTITNAVGTSVTSSADDYTYELTPTVTAISPVTGPSSGNTSVTITGTSFTGATSVEFGSQAASAYTVDSPTEITATSPPVAASTVDVTVTTPSGTSSTSSADQFTYEGVSTGVQVTVPGAPTNVSATAGNAAATVTWSLPADNGSAIVTYTVIATDSTNSSNGGESSVVDGAAMTSCIGAGLTNGDSYTFTVTSTNGVGTGPASSDSNPVTPMAVPGAPRNVSATRGNASATVSWTAPSSDGGSAITRYVVIVSGSGAKACVTAGTTSCTVTSLSNGIAYTFTVTAANEFGTGPASSASNQITLLAPSRTALKMSATTLTYGDEQVEQLSVVVSSQYSGSMPTGTVNLSESGVRLCTITLSAGAGSCRLDATRLDARDYHIVAAYRGDDVFVSSVTGGRLTVLKAPSTTAFKLSATALTYGDEQVENLTVTVSSQYPGSMPTGIVTVRGQSLTLCTITLSAGSGSCSLSATQLAMGSHQVFATYHGDEALVRSVAGESLTVVRPSPSTTAFQLSATTLTYGDEQVENMTVTVSSQVPGSMPTGIVTVRGQSLRLCTITLSAGSDLAACPRRSSPWAATRSSPLITATRRSCARLPVRASPWSGRRPGPPSSCPRPP